LGVIETMRGNFEGDVIGGDAHDSGRSCNDDATGGDNHGVILGKGGMSHGRGMRSSEEGAVFLIGGNGILSDCWVTGIDVGKDRGNSRLTGSGVSSIGTGGSYCSIDEYSRRCDPQGTRGSDGDATRGGGSSGGDLGIDVGMNWGNGMTSLGRDNDGWMNGWMTGTGPTGGGGAMIGTDGGASGTAIVDPPVPEGLGLSMNTGNGDLLLKVLLQFLRSVRSPSRNR